jgi:hypothetical protein
MAKRSIRHLLRKKRTEKKALSPEMRNLMVSFEAQYEQRDPKAPKQSGPQSNRR